MNVMKLATRPVVTVDVHDHCRHAAELMNRFYIRHLPVLHDGRPVGMVSDRDLLASIGHWYIDAQHPEGDVPAWADQLLVDRIMSAPLICVAPDDPPEKAVRLMLNKKLSAVPIVGEDCLHGIVTETDLLRSFAGDPRWHRQTVDGWMSARVIFVSPDELIRTAWRLMRDKQMRHLLVANEGALAGILSDRDLLCAITWEAAGPLGIQERVQQIMTRDVATIDRHASLAQAVSAMLSTRIGALPVIDQTSLVGIITETDLLRTVLAAGEET